MIDIHCHLLPGIDDGAEDLDTALMMARMAADSGVETIITTPHCNLPGTERNNYISAELAGDFLRLQEAIRKEEIPLTILPGAEVMCTPQVPELVRQGVLPTLAGSDYLLMEFFFDEDLSYMDSILSSVSACGLHPVIAHPERYEAVQEMPQVIDRWFHAGVVIQLNKGSILGRLGRRAERTARWILERGLAHAVASDAHSAMERTPRMDELQRWLEDEIDPAYTGILLEENPSRICRNRPLLQAD